MENHHAINAKTHYKWPFSIAVLVYQRVYPINIPLNHYKIPLNHYKIPLISIKALILHLSLHIWTAFFPVGDDRLAKDSEALQDLLFSAGTMCFCRYKLVNKP